MANILNHEVLWVHCDGMHNSTKLAADSLPGLSLWCI